MLFTWKIYLFEIAFNIIHVRFIKENWGAINKLLFIFTFTVYV